MSLRFAVLSSGSVATTFFVAYEKKAILVDAGLRFKDVYSRVEGLGESVEAICGLFYSHEHCDHSSGLRSLITAFRKPVYCRSAAAKTKVISNVLIEKYAPWVSLDNGPVEVGGMVVDTFPVVHDTVDPVGFVVEAGGRRLVIATDLGEVTPIVREKALAANLLFLESNYDEDMLDVNEYSQPLRDRVKRSHLSNREASNLVANLGPAHRVVLGHISQKSNSAELVAAIHRNNKAVTVMHSGQCSNMFEV